MSTALVVTGITVLTLGFVGRKSWLAFHRMVGLSPNVPRQLNEHHRLQATPQASLPAPASTKQSQSHRHLDPHLAASLTDNMGIYDKVWAYLSPQMTRQLHRIHAKAERHYKEQGFTLNAQGQLAHASRSISEADFLTHKLVYERLPEMLTNFYHLFANTPNLATPHPEAHPQQLLKQPEKPPLHQQAQQLLKQFLDNVEARLDALHRANQHHHFTALKSMVRYTQTRV